MASERTGRSSASASRSSPGGAPPEEHRGQESGGEELRFLDSGVVRERADAVRNRARVLDAAQRLFAERGVAAVTMDDLAAAAGVGKGTLYRRFPNKGAVAHALLDEAERDLQFRILSGPPPLGPGSPAVERFVAFVTAYVTFAVRTLPLLVPAEAGPGARLHSGAHAFWRQHCRHLLATAGAPDALLRADMILAALSADQVNHWTLDQQRSPSQLVEALSVAARTLAAPP